MRFSGAKFSDIDYRDIQGLVRHGHGHLEGARFFLLDVQDPATARAWLAKAPITTAVSGQLPDVALQVLIEDKTTATENYGGSWKDRLSCSD